MSTINITPAKGTRNLDAGVYSIVYTAPLSCISATVNARLISHDLTQNIKTRIAIVPNSFTEGTIAPTNDLWSSPVDMVIGPNGITSGIIEDTAIVLSPGESIVMYTDLGNANARVHGLIRTVGV